MTTDMAKEEQNLGLGEDLQPRVEIDDQGEVKLEFVTEFEEQNELEVLTLVASQSTKRLDSFLGSELTEFSRSRLQKMIKDGLVLVNQMPAKPSCPLAIGDEVMLFLPLDVPIDVQPEPLPLDIIYEDEDVVVVNKARGMVVHPAPGNYSGTLVNALLHHCKDLSGINGAIRPGIVHRIDKETTGLIIAAKNDFAHQGLVEQWQSRTVERHYTALLHGAMTEPGGRIEAPIGRHPKDRKKMAVLREGGRGAITNYQVLQNFAKYALIDAKLETGRTHQIRVHMSYLNHPVVGDLIYGPKAKPKVGQLLHSTKMTFTQPRTGKVITCTAPLPLDFQGFLNKLQGQ